jgi:hypothetical protein
VYVIIPRPWDLRMSIQKQARLPTSLAYRVVRARFRGRAVGSFFHVVVARAGGLVLELVSSFLDLILLFLSQGG